MSRRHTVLAAMLMACATPASAFDLDCAGLRTIIAQADTGFAKLKGAPRTHVASGAPAMPQRLLNEYERQSWQGKLLLAGASSCEVARTRITGREAILDQVHYACRYPGLSTLPRTLNRSLATCAGRPIDPDADTTSTTIVLDRVDSGEGHATTALGASANIVEGLQVLVSRVVCQTRTLGGCDDEEEDED